MPKRKRDKKSKGKEKKLTRDFVKKRRKLGKKLEKSSATKTSFKAKRIRVHDQNVGPLHAEDTYEIEELLELLLSKTSTGREKLCEEALLGLKNCLLRDGKIAEKHPDRFVNLFKKCWDPSKIVRTALLSFLQTWFRVVQEKSVLASHLGLIFNCLQAAFTHRERSVQRDSLGFIRLVLQDFMHLIPTQRILDLLPKVIQKLHATATTQSFNSKKVNIEVISKLIQLISQLLNTACDQEKDAISQEDVWRAESFETMSQIMALNKDRQKTLLDILIQNDCITVLVNAFHWLYMDKRWSEAKRILLIFRKCSDTCGIQQSWCESWKKRVFPLLDEGHLYQEIAYLVWKCDSAGFTVSKSINHLKDKISLTLKRKDSKKFIAMGELFLHFCQSHPPGTVAAFLQDFTNFSFPLDAHPARVSELCLHCALAISNRRHSEVDGFQTHLSDHRSDTTASFQSFCEDWFTPLCRYLLQPNLREDTLIQLAETIRLVHAFEEDCDLEDSQELLSQFFQKNGRFWSLKPDIQRRVFFLIEFSPLSTLKEVASVVMCMPVLREMLLKYVEKNKADLMEYGVVNCRDD